jgi:TRAP-type C4-dicarboxylate transport system permease large subunit
MGFNRSWALTRCILEVGMCHPPVGLNLYVASGITKRGITALSAAVWPWLLAMLGFLGVGLAGQRCRSGYRGCRG